ncbi:DNA-directed RNA polymerase I, II and III subunit Rpb5 [Schizosaccharomyces osmophilus]|uniref:DNA-directed RNA polymerases I, II, and III subunit RPABC1 n=1 Tax=Schizosaccharomyces osmophilus TaxID=2545709 RepID=A0AAF0AU66_9SCHI|nr:DNA-directed RNA polymerase I, II and III subunit Rpb5 [Schizosaccharomyces osmophilus]WBW71297.1 DNA-directed RNA polymerase I, II and III subunit Rpb5 [Schizosaccharomyces osmophilus]
MSADERNIVKVFRAWKTAHQLVHDRGYGVSQAELDLTLDQFKAMHCGMGRNLDRSTLSFYAKPPAGSDKGTIYVEFSKEPSVGIKEMRTFVHTLGDHNHKTGILIYANSMTPSAAKIISTVTGQFSIETFQESDLIVNITHHELVPRHNLLTPDEKKELLDRYKLRETQLPRIQLADPVARYLGLKRGQVVKIVRKSETSGRYNSYRICA